MAWIGVDRDGATFLFDNKPIYHRGKWYNEVSNIATASQIDPNLLPFKVRVTNLYEIEIVKK